MPDDQSYLCDGPQRDEETVEVTASALLPPVLTDFDWLESPESDVLLQPIELLANEAR